jgi:photosystem II stability/assembly factor-like uncharacterized protein
MNWPLGSAAPFALSVVVGSGLLSTCSSAEAATTVYELVQLTHFHGLEGVPADISRLYLATHDGLFILDPAGTAHPVSEMRDDLVGFAPHPTDPSILYASGHSAGGGNLGFVVSIDGGKSWTRLSEGVDGPVDFHQLDVSAADPKTIYGAYAGQLQVSRDGGGRWEVVGPSPEGLIDFAASSKEPATLYAATLVGLRKSQDGGRSWHDAYGGRRQPATMVHVTPGGAVHAFVVGTGLIETEEPDLSWKIVSKDVFRDDYVLDFAVDPRNPSKLYAISFDPHNKQQSVLASDDAGKTWAPLGSETN